MDSENHGSRRRSIQREHHPIQRRVHEIDDGRGHPSIHRIRKEPFRSTHAWTNMRTTRNLRNTLESNEIKSNDNNTGIKHECGSHERRRVVRTNRLSWKCKLSDPPQRGSEERETARDSEWDASERERKEEGRRMGKWGNLTVFGWGMIGGLGRSHVISKLPVT